MSNFEAGTEKTAALRVRNPNPVEITIENIVVVVGSSRTEPSRGASGAFTVPANATSVDIPITVQMPSDPALNPYPVKMFMDFAGGTFSFTVPGTVDVWVPRSLEPRLEYDATPKEVGTPISFKVSVDNPNPAVEALSALTLWVDNASKVVLDVPLQPSKMGQPIDMGTYKMPFTENLAPGVSVELSWLWRGQPLRKSFPPIVVYVLRPPTIEFIVN